MEKGGGLCKRKMFLRMEPFLSTVNAGIFFRWISLLSSMAVERRCDEAAVVEIKKWNEDGF